MFEDYLVLITPEEGLLKILATGKTIQTNPFGEELRDAFVEVQKALSKIYGEPKVADYLMAGSIWREPRDWMTGLRKKERHLSAFWLSALPNNIQTIALEAAAGSSDSAGWLYLTYECNGWSACLQQRKAARDDVF